MELEEGRAPERGGCIFGTVKIPHSVSPPLLSGARSS